MSEILASSVESEDPAIASIPTTHLRRHAFAALAPGPRLLVLGAVHGNETCGSHAMVEIIEAIDAGLLPITRGSVSFVPVTNPLAFAKGQRVGDRNLNRNMAPSAIPQDYESRIANVLCPLLEAHDVLLDLHSFHTGGAPFVMIGPQNNKGPLEPFSHAAAEMQLALHTGPHRIVEGWLETYARGVERRRHNPIIGGENRSQALVIDTNYGVGTTEYMRAKGGYGVTLECGQHDDPEAVHIARHAILQTLALLGITPEAPKAEPASREILRLIEVTDRADAGDAFSKAWRSFDEVKAGELVGTRHSGEPVLAAADGFIVFPNPKAEVGQEWFYFAQPRSAF